MSSRAMPPSINSTTARCASLLRSNKPTTVFAIIPSPFVYETSPRRASRRAATHPGGRKTGPPPCSRLAWVESLDPRLFAAECHLLRTALLAPPLRDVQLLFEDEPLLDHQHFLEE